MLNPLRSNENIVMQKTRKNKLSDAPILSTLEGDEYKITAGRKLQEARSYCRDPEITDAQFRALFVIIDRLNDGRIDEESRWGSAYPSYGTLAADIGKDERAAKRIIKELTTGQREKRSKYGERSLVPCKAVLNVKSTKSGKTDEVNEYRMKTLGAFAITDEGKGAVTEPRGGRGAGPGEEGGGDRSEGGRSPEERGAVNALDSSYLPPSEIPLIDPPHVPPASGQRVPAVAMFVGDAEKQSDAMNDDKVEPWPDDIVDKFQSHYPKGGDRSKIVQALEEIRREGRTEYRDILRGASNYRGENVGVEPRYLKSPENFLKGRLWTGYQKDNRPKPKKVAAI